MYRYKLFIVLWMLIMGITLVVRSCQPQARAAIADEPTDIYRLNDSLRNSLSEMKETERMERYIRNWMARNNLRGVSLAVMRNEKLIYAKGFGWADKEMEREAEAGDIYRIASASKLITAIGIMKLVDEGKLSTDQLVFGEKGILNEYTEFRDKKAAKITVEHLLNHTSGFSRRLGDPMFRSADVMRWTNKTTTLSADDLIRFQLNQRLRCAPGGSAQYSNIGYLVLSCIIERVSGM
ncbi:MAG: beta-lactamase family protein, partial [Alistipes sp.]|nr:beta-lactamase family protein [Alistipes sp.]